MKKERIQAVVMILLVVLAVGLIGTIAYRLNSSKPFPVISGEYRIEYRAIEIAGEERTEEEVYAPLYYEGGSYPTSYNFGEETEISDLRGRVTREPVPEGWGMDGIYTESGAFFDPANPNREYQFEGWYLDAACTEELEGGKIPSDSAGDIVLYAKIRTNKWTDLY